MQTSRWNLPVKNSLACLGAILSIVLCAPTGASAQPPILDGPTLDDPAVPAQPDPSPPGANDWDCTPSPEHPRPVVLVHGTNGNMAVTWDTLAPLLADEGYCVFALNYGGGRMVVPPYSMMWGVRDIRDSAVELARFVDRVRTETGSAQVDIVGHSQGGTVARQYLRFAGGANPDDPALNKVHTLVTLGATNHGTTWSNDIAQRLFEIAAALGYGNDELYRQLFGIAVSQQTIGSPFLEELNEGRETMPGVNYTVVATRYDEVVTPPALTFLRSQELAPVNNVWVQDGCDLNTVSHANLARDPRTLFLVQAGLDPSYADRHTAPCTVTTPSVGDSLTDPTGGP